MIRALARSPLPKRSLLARMALAVFALIAAPLALAASPPEKPALRCGWFDNPTPGNAWLIDRDGQWIVGTQGGHQADGDWPEFQPKDWVSTNRSYGYGCACLQVVANARTKEIKQIVSAKARPLSACWNDPAVAKRRPTP